MRAQDCPDGDNIDRPALLTRLSINPAAWLRTMMTHQGLATGTTFGTERSMNEAAKRQGKRWLKSKRAAQALFRNTAAAA